MKKLFIDAKSDVEIVPVLAKSLNILPERVGLVTTAQHLQKLEEAKNFLEKNNKKVIIGGQVLGCNSINAERISEKVDCILFIGSGNFHPLGMLTKLKKIIVANPFTNQVKEIKEEEIIKIERLRKSALSRFYMADKVGVIISVKEGQLIDIDRKKIEKKYKDKKFYYFLCDTLHFEELENFPFIKAWVNTMCPRIGYDDLLRTKFAIVNLEDI
ncbi:MAG: diphthamide synthesis protein [Candidatus Woesearchaeota archaeon]